MLGDLQQLYMLPLTTLAPLIVVLLFVLGCIVVTAYILITDAIERGAEGAAKRAARDGKRRIYR